MLAQPRIHVFAVTLEPVRLGTDGVETLLDGAVDALDKLLVLARQREKE